MLIKCTQLILIYLTIVVGNPVSPQPPNTSKWLKYKEGFPKKHQDSILNEKIVKYLDLCYKPGCCVAKDEGLCKTYFDMVAMLNKAVPEILITNSEIEETVMKDNSSTNATIFCNKMQQVIPDSSIFKRTPICLDICFDSMPTKVGFILSIMPVCQMFDLMAFKLLSKTSTNTDIKKIESTNINQEVTLKTVLFEEIPAQPAQTITKQEIKTVTDAPKSITIKNNSFVLPKEPEKLPTPDQNKSKQTIQQENVKINAKASNDNSKLPAATPPTISMQTKKKATTKDLTNLEKVNQSNEDGYDNENLANEDDEKIDNINDQLYNYGSETDPNIGKAEKPDIKRDPEVKQDSQLEIKQDLTISKPKEQTTFQKMDEIKASFNNVVKSDPFYEQSGSNFFTYLLIGMFGCILLYVAYHNKSKILALLLEGRRGNKSRNGKRKHTAAYRKLDTNLEEAISSPSSGRSSQVIY